MITALQATREELATLRLRVDCLERAELIIRPAYEQAEPRRLATPALSAARPATRRRPSSGNPTRTQLREHIIAHGPLTRGELVAALGGNPKLVSDRLRRLLEAGEIGADGRPGARRYRSPDAPEVVSVSSVSRKTSASQPLPARGVYPMYDAIVDLEGPTTKQLSERMGLPTSVVVEQGRRLVRLGLVRFTQAGEARVWRASGSEIGGDGV
jgi:hypothetical protein